ncbi:Dipeptidase A [Scardovia inopinata]|uniref:Dipeptidase n=1 Tax=Scardovia inopinata F0304 TaxID=641146 RepID=W5IGG1_SCAIO|nr:C69 family dipeptidase [Scardovia inopinata]EFG26014.1 hypothetical protein HMPREF9020_01085 [Scardovia inopinata F0304]BAR07356.1 dipeptidase [Scardovia inopinata JCM 12537]SUV51433.1 Dipeptidase A [Scardovia inopinata]
MACTTILVGKNASYDGSTIIARNEDSPNGEFTPKELLVVNPQDQPRVYKSVISHVTIELPDNPQRYTAVPDALRTQGIWGSHGVNASNVALSCTETITSNERVLGADPLVELQPAQGKEGDPDYQPEVPGGIGEEDILTLVLPYVSTARQGVKRYGQILHDYGTYEMNGIAISDVNEIWWVETVGGHHWIARRVPDDSYVTMPNQFGIDEFDFDDALGEQEEFMCSEDLPEFVEDNHLNLALESTSPFNPRWAFGSHSDSDHVYNTPRAWYMQRYFNPLDASWDGEDADFTPVSDDLPWCRQPDHKITIEDVKYILSAHYQGTPYDPYGKLGTPATRTLLRPIGINRTNHLCVIQLRPYAPEVSRAIQWTAFSSNVFNALIPVYANVAEMPAYYRGEGEDPSTDNFYWANRIIAALADARFHDNAAFVDRYVEKVGGLGYAMIAATDAAVNDLVGSGKAAADEMDNPAVRQILTEANQTFAQKVQKETNKLLSQVLYTTSMGMTNGYHMSDN